MPSASCPLLRPGLPSTTSHLRTSWSIVVVLERNIQKIALWSKNLSCNPTLTGFYSKQIHTLFSPLPTPNQHKIFIKHTFFEKKNPKDFLPTYLPFFLDCYRKQTISFYVLLQSTGELGYDGPLYDGSLPTMTDDMLGPSSMQIKYSSYVYDGFCI